MKKCKDLYIALRKVGDYLYNNENKYNYHNSADCNCGLLVKFLFPEYFNDKIRDLKLSSEPRMYYWSDHFYENNPNSEYTCPTTGYKLNIIYKKLVNKYNFTIVDFEILEYFGHKDYKGSRSHIKINNVINYFYFLANKMEREINV